MRFDDSLDTVLGADIATPFGAQSMWRQAHRPDRARDVRSQRPEALAQLRALRVQVPGDVRARRAPAASRLPNRTCSAGPACLVRTIRRSRRRSCRQRDSTHRRMDRHHSRFAARVPIAAASPSRLAGGGDAGARQPMAPAISRCPQPDSTGSSRSHARNSILVTPIRSERSRARSIRPDLSSIAELVARLDAYQRDHGDLNRPPRPDVDSTGRCQPCLSASKRMPTGTIRWVHGVPREPLIGVRLGAGPAQVDGVVSGAFRRRAAVQQRTARRRRPVGCVGRLANVGDPGVRSGQWPLHRLSRRRPASARPDERAEPISRKSRQPQRHFVPWSTSCARRPTRFRASPR